MIPCLPSSISLDTLTLAIWSVSHCLQADGPPEHTANIQHRLPKKYVLISSNTLCRDFGASLKTQVDFSKANTSLLSNHVLNQPSHFPLQQRIRMNFQIQCKETAPIPINQRALCGLALDCCVTELKPGKVSKIKWMLVKKDFSEGLDHKSKEVGLFGFGVFF